MKFYMTPGSCSTGIHILLEELELIFEVAIVDLLAGDQRNPEYLAINPKGTIPCLQSDDGHVYNDFLAIAWWLATQHPKAKLLPADPQQQIEVMQSVNYITGTIHGQGFTRIFTSEQYSRDPAELDWVQQQGREIIQQGFDIIAAQLAQRIYLFDDYSIADAALFYVEFWADKTELPLPAACQQHYYTMLQRRAVRQVLAEEGYRLPASHNSQ